MHIHNCQRLYDTYDNDADDDNIQHHTYNLLILVQYYCI